MAKLLTSHDEIRQWAEARAGTPMMMETPDGHGGDIPLLQITFGQHMLNADRNEGPDRPTGGFELVSWDDWLTALEGQGLAIRVRDEEPGQLDNNFEFVPSDGSEGTTTDAAKKPAAITVDRGARR